MSSLRFCVATLLVADHWVSGKVTGKDSDTATEAYWIHIVHL